MTMEELKKLANDAESLQESGMMRTITEAERIRFKELFPYVEVMIGDYVVLKYDNYRKLHQ